MSIKLFCAFLLLFVLQNICNAAYHGEKDENWLNSVYYNWKTELKDTFNTVKSIKYHSSSPCYCEKLPCIYCANLDIPKLVNGKACITVTYLPQKLGIKLITTLDGEELFSQTVSVRNPMPICILIPYVRVGKVCVRVYDVDVVRYSMHMCAELTVTEVDYVLHFGCFQIGFNGIQEMISKYTSNVKTMQTNPQISQPEIKIQPQRNTL